VLEVFEQVLKLCVQGDEFHGRTSRHFVEFNWKKRTDEILRGDFVKLRGPLDLAEVQEGYSAGVEEGSKFGRAGAIDRDHEERCFYSWIGISGVREVRP
jgi:hypothetical protein